MRRRSLVRKLGEPISIFNPLFWIAAPIRENARTRYPTKVSFTFRCQIIIFRSKRWSCTNATSLLSFQSQVDILVSAAESRHVIHAMDVTDCVTTATVEHTSGD